MGVKEQLHVAAVQCSPSPSKEMDKNVQYIIHKIDRLAKEGKELIVFPELSLSSFYEHHPHGREEYWQYGAVAIDSPAIKKIVDAVKERNVHVVVGFAERSDIIGKFYNSAVLIGPNGIIGVTRKIHLPGLEKLYFSQGTEIPVFDTPVGKIGISICYDSWFPEHLRVLTVKGCEIMVIISSIWGGGNKGGIGSPDSKRYYADHLPAMKAIENQVYIIACGAGGSHYMGSGHGYWTRLGLSKIISPSGEILAQSEGNEEVVLDAFMAARDLEISRNIYTMLADRHPLAYKELSSS
jgi:predicted amidohydrolase